MPFRLLGRELLLLLWMPSTSAVLLIPFDRIRIEYLYCWWNQIGLGWQ